MSNTVEFCSVVCIICLWGQLSTSKLYQASNDQVGLSFSHLLSCEKNFEKIQVPLPHETGFNAADNPYTESEFLKICEDYRVPNDPMKYRDEKFYWTYQCDVRWPDDYIGPDSMTWWILEKSVGSLTLVC